MERKKQLSKHLLPHEICEELDRLKTKRKNIVYETISKFCF